MKTPLAILNLLHQKVRTCVAVLGVAFAIILVFMQLGFFGSVEATATQVFEQLDFDLLVVSSEYINLNRPDSFPGGRLLTVKQSEHVTRADPLYVGYHLWRNPLPAARTRRSIMVLGYHIEDPVFRLPAVKAAARDLQIPDRVLIDRSSRPEFGPQDTGVTTEIGQHQVTIVGQFDLGAGFAADGLIVGSDQTFARIFAGYPLEQVSLGLVKLKPGVAPAAAAAQLTAALPSDVRVLTRPDIESHERRYWVRDTSIGIIFGLGVVVALLVGMVFVYQVITGDIASHIGEYATLKAMGYPHRYLAGVVLQEALILALVSFLPALGLTLVLYELTAWLAAVPIAMTWSRLLFVLVLSIGMCGLSGIFAIQKVKSADPADLF